jgi:hypothetical protein
MHEKILQGVTVGIVAGLAVYWLTSRNHEGFQSSRPADYKPSYGDIRSLSNGIPTCACCQCCGLDAPSTVSIPLASDYLDCVHGYAPPTSDFNIGISLQISCRGIDLDGDVNRQETAVTFPVGVRSRNSVARPLNVSGGLCCSPDVPLQIDCTEVV